MRRRYSLARSDNYPVPGVAQFSTDVTILEDEDLAYSFVPTCPVLVTRANINFSRGVWLKDYSIEAVVAGNALSPKTLASGTDANDETVWGIDPLATSLPAMGCLYLVPGDSISFSAGVAASTRSSSSSETTSANSSSSSSQSVSSQSSSSSVISISSSTLSASSLSTESTSSESSPSTASSESSESSSSSVLSSTSSIETRSSSSSSPSSASSETVSHSTSSQTELSSSASSVSSSSESSSSSSEGRRRAYCEIHFVPLYALSESEISALGFA